MEKINYLETEAKSANGQLIGHARRLGITLRQNLDEQIKQAEATVETLKATKERMEKSGILDARIDDIRRAMRF